MRVKVSESATLFWSGGRLVWDDPVRRSQHALTAESEVLLRWFARWRELESARELGERSLAVARRLLEAGVLVEEGSAAHAAEGRLHERWRVWGASARQFHLAARTPAGQRWLSPADDAAEMRAREDTAPPPPVATSLPDQPLVPLPGTVADGWARPRMLDALQARRSTRRFAAEPLGLEELATVVQLAAGIADRLAEGGGVLKTSPAAGAWHPVEVYVEARRVEGLAPGVYHYAPTRGGLEDLGRAPLGEAAGAALGNQPWLADAPALLVYTGVLERAQWRYRSARAYRDVLIGLGHVSQTVLLTASAMGLGAVFATAVCDEDLERHLGCDPVDEVVLGVTALGRPAG